MKKIGIIDCGTSNLTSVRNAFESQGLPAVILREKERLGDCSHLVLPGVGAFQAGMANLRENGFDEIIIRQVQAGKPLLGICLGMQFLASRSEEFGLTDGLDLIPSAVVKIETGGQNLRLPHVGWNSVRQTGGLALWTGIADETPFYFVHTFAFSSQTPSAWVAGTCDYGGEVVAAVAKENVFGVQFHPEKSQKAGLTLLKNFADLC